jgi:hypothetical protein
MEELDFEGSSGIVNEFAQKYLELLAEKKQVDFKIKKLKIDYEEQSIPTKLIITSLNEYRKEKKVDEEVLRIKNKYKSYFKENSETLEKIDSLDC